MNLNKLHKQKVHKIAAKKHITLMMIKDPTQGAKVIKFPKWIRFLAYASIILVTWSIFNFLQYVTELESQLASNRYDILTTNSVVSEKETMIDELSSINEEHKDRLQEFKTLSAELDRKLEDLESYKNELDIKLNGTEETTASADPQPSKEIQVIEADLMVYLNDESGIPEGYPEDLDASYEEFDLDISLLIEKTKTSILELEETLDTYESLDLRVEELLPYWEAYPSGAPVSDTHISSDFGWRKDPFWGGLRFHTGTDFDVKYATVFATGKGVVTYTGYKGSYGYTVIIDHGYGYETLYAHLSDIEVSVGDEVIRGDEIAISGRSGRATGAHLHYEVMVNGTCEDPENYIE